MLRQTLRNSLSVTLSKKYSIHLCAQNYIYILLLTLFNAHRFINFLLSLRCIIFFGGLLHCIIIQATFVFRLFFHNFRYWIISGRSSISYISVVLSYFSWSYCLVMLLFFLINDFFLSPCQLANILLTFHCRYFFSFFFYNNNCSFSPKYENIPTSSINYKRYY